MIAMVRSIIDSVVEGAIKRISGKGMADESDTNREYFQHYGFTSIPLEGAEAILLRQGNQLIVIASDDRRYRLSVEEGEVALYTDEGDHIHMKRGNEMHVKTGKLIVDFANEIQFGEGATDGIVQKKCVCAYTGNEHPMASVKVKSVL